MIRFCTTRVVANIDNGCIVIDTWYCSILTCMTKLYLRYQNHGHQHSYYSRDWFGRENITKIVGQKRKCTPISGLHQHEQERVRIKFVKCERLLATKYSSFCEQLLQIPSPCSQRLLLRQAVGIQGNKTDISYLKTSRVLFLHKSFN